jgi:uncharacterized membrane-anchored protein
VRRRRAGCMDQRCGPQVALGERPGRKLCDTGPMPTDELTQDRPRANLRLGSSRVPEVTVAFWVTKALTTGFGESSSDYLVHRLPPVLAVALGGIALAGALVVQFKARRYVPWIYWLAVAMVGVSGTMAADVLHVGLGVPYVASTTFFAVALAVVFAIWWATEKTLSIHSIHTRRREIFYWAAVMTTFALGTAAGDMTAITLHLGYLSSGVLFAVVIAVPALAHWRFGMNAILAFWLAYIATRPLGASFADWMGVSHARGGLDLGPGPVSLALATLIVGCVIYLSLTPTGRDNSGRLAAEESPHLDPKELFTREEPTADDTWRMGSCPLPVRAPGGTAAAVDSNSQSWASEHELSQRYSEIGQHPGKPCLPGRRWPGR